MVNPARGEGISFRASFADDDGNTGKVTAIDAHHGR